MAIHPVLSDEFLAPEEFDDIRLTRGEASIIDLDLEDDMSEFLELSGEDDEEED